MIISLWMLVAQHLLQPTRRHERAALVASLFGLAPNGVYHAVHVAMNAVSSYLTISPLPGYIQAVYFLWHFPPVTRCSCYEPFYPEEFGLSSLAKSQSDHAPAPRGNVMIMCKR